MRSIGYYRQFILNFAKGVRPLTAILKKRLTTDASNYALDAVLRQGEVGKDSPIAFGSKNLDGAEINYSTIEKGLLVIVWAVRYFLPYLYGREFTLITDHRPLVWLHGLKDPVSRLARWKIRRSEYDYVIQYTPGKMNSNADALSLNPCDLDQCQNKKINGGGTFSSTRIRKCTRRE